MIMKETSRYLHLQKAEKVTDREGRMIKIVDKFHIESNLFHDIVPVRAGYIKCSPGYLYGPFIRDSWTIQYVCDGLGTIQKGDVCHTAHPAECFVLRPGEEVTLIADSMNTWTYIWIGFRSSVELPEIWYRQDIIPAAELEELFLEIANCNQPANRPVDELLISYIWRLIFSFKRMSPAASTDLKNSELYVEQACQMIHEHCGTITVLQLSEALNLNRSYLSRIFREYTGLSLQAYICNARLQSARDLLLDNHSVSQTAALTGYSDVSGFSHAFKAYFRQSPKQYLQRHGTHSVHPGRLT